MERLVADSSHLGDWRQQPPVHAQRGMVCRKVSVLQGQGWDVCAVTGRIDTPTLDVVSRPTV